MDKTPVRGEVAPRYANAPKTGIEAAKCEMGGEFPEQVCFP
jgi:hypothetical protein